jgi:hypothetical protein
MVTKTIPETTQAIEVTNKRMRKMALLRRQQSLPDCALASDNGGSKGLLEEVCIEHHSATGASVVIFVGTGHSRGLDN